MYAILNLNYHDDVIQLVCNEEQLEEIKEYIKRHKHLSIEELLDNILSMFDYALSLIYTVNN